jgi:ceramide glucosyltransferase
LLIFYIFLTLALVGTVSSMVFLGLVCLGVIRFRRQTQAALRATPRNEALPPVSVLKPVHGLEARLEENIESFFRLDYPNYEILFAADEPDDPALNIVRAVSARHSRIPCRIVVNGPPPWPNPPAFSFHCMAQVAAHDILVTSDSDVEVGPHYLREVVAPLLNPKIGMVTCVYRGKNAGGFWSGLDAIGMSVEMTAGVLVANLLEGLKFGLGPTIAVRKDALAKIGGYQALGNYFANDFVIGNLIDRAGYQVVLSGHVIDHVSPPMTLGSMWRRLVRWAKSTRYSRPKGHFGTGLIFAMPYGLLGFIAALLLGLPVLAVLLLAGALLNRMLEAWIVGWGVVRDPKARNAPWLYPVRDLLGFAVWCSSYLSSRSVWRDSSYQLLAGGFIVRKPAADLQSDSAPSSDPGTIHRLR